MYLFFIRKSFFQPIVLLFIILIGIIPFAAIAQDEQNLADNTSFETEDELKISNAFQQKSFFDQQSLLGSFFGVRDISTPLGIEFGGMIKNDLWKNISGGNNRQSTDIVNIDLTLSADMQETIGWEGSSIFIHFLVNNGKSVSNSVGDYQKVSNIEAYSMGKLYQCWFQQKIFHGDISVLVGIFDLNSEFYVTQSSGLFLNSSHGIGIDLGQTGNNGPSIFPNAALAFRISYSPIENIYSRVAVFDGIPGDPRDPNKFGVALSASDGFFTIAEAGVENSSGNKIGAGVWKYSGTFNDLCTVIDPARDGSRTDNYGGYLLVDQVLYQNDLRSVDMLRSFLRIGMANGHLNNFNFHIGGGFVYKGIFPSRDEDDLGYAFALAHASDDFQAENKSIYQTTQSVEISHEITYSMKIAEWFSVQYDVQYILHPSVNPVVSNALVGGIRFGINL